jgi:hypothetical protein
VETTVSIFINLNLNARPPLFEVRDASTADPEQLARLFDINATAIEATDTAADTGRGALADSLPHLANSFGCPGSISPDSREMTRPAYAVLANVGAHCGTFAQGRSVFFGSAPIWLRFEGDRETMAKFFPVIMESIDQKVRGSKS